MHQVSMLLFFILVMRLFSDVTNIKNTINTYFIITDKIKYIIEYDETALIYIKCCDCCSRQFVLLMLFT